MGPVPRLAIPARILAVGAYRPGRGIANAELSESLDTSDSWIVKRTGIRRRCAASPAETVVTMGAAAAGKALASAGKTIDAVDCVVAATMSYTGQSPSAAVQIARELGARRVGAFDVSAACAGFNYALDVARALIAAGSARHVLVVASERMSDLVDPGDRTTAVIFSDGAGAALVGAYGEPGIGPMSCGSDGSLAGVAGQDFPWAHFRDTPGCRRPYFRMRGPELFRWAISEMPAVALRAVDAAGLALEDLAAFIPHQANLRMIEAIAERIPLPGHVVVARDVEDQGNTSAASIPLAISRLKEEGAVPAGAFALLLGFGAGVAYGAQVVRLP
nr:beta-ketoacyl-ACP synthase 3 [Nonomuraea sp. SBT364]